MKQDLTQIIKQQPNKLFEIISENTDISIGLVSHMNSKEVFKFETFKELIGNDLFNTDPNSFYKLFDNLIKAKNDSKLYVLTLNYYDSLIGYCDVSVYFSDSKELTKAWRYMQLEIDKINEIEYEETNEEKEVTIDFFGKKITGNSRYFRLKLSTEISNYEFL